MSPVFRAVPPSAAQLAADADAPHIVYLRGNRDLLALATAAAGIGIDLGGETARVCASSAELERLAWELERLDAQLATCIRRYLNPVPLWKLRTVELPLDRPLLMGILNLTTDSFSGDGIGFRIEAAVRRASELRDAGAAIIDAGAESARADRPALEPEVEATLVGSVVAALVHESHVVSSDTYKPLVARVALESGAEIVNDISGLTVGTGAAGEAAKAGAGYVLNYSYSVPKRRPDAPPEYNDVVAETVSWMETKTAELFALGLSPAQVVIDPGIAFGKSHDEDIQVLRRLGELRSAGLPILLAHSRKNFIGSINSRPPAERDLETHVLSVMAYEQGARIFRVHDPAGAVRALEMAAALTGERAGAFGPDANSWPWRAGAAAAHMTEAEPDKAAPRGQRW